mmetsp:Transcript_51334/g.129571  ORF Transcript_51334/g.129571 Transcript_51334/m.129571 type:complete len:470 (-) Transcript_51334:83-1492(-)
MPAEQRRSAPPRRTQARNGLDRRVNPAREHGRPDHCHDAQQGNRHKHRHGRRYEPLKPGPNRAARDPSVPHTSNCWDGCCPHARDPCAPATDVEGVDVEVAAAQCRAAHGAVTEKISGAAGLHLGATKAQCTVKNRMVFNLQVEQLGAAIAHDEGCRQGVVLEDQALEEVHVAGECGGDPVKHGGICRQSLLHGLTHGDIVALVADDGQQRVMTEVDVCDMGLRSRLQSMELGREVFDVFLHRRANCWRIALDPAVRLRALEVIIGIDVSILDPTVVDDQELLVLKWDLVHISALSAIVCCPILRQRPRVQEHEETMASACASLVIPAEHNPWGGLEQSGTRLKEIGEPTIPIVAPLAGHADVNRVVDVLAALALRTRPLAVEVVADMDHNVRTLLRSPVSDALQWPLYGSLVGTLDQIWAEGDNLRALFDTIELFLCESGTRPEISRFDPQASISQQNILRRVACDRR